ncbi:MAG TPA: hypothetical protein EYP60_05115 [bacterium (Candidatus Stahlbacteria)]|nr:hypothetical protein [Candidatus Stahlbacteria bacterium]
MTTGEKVKEIIKDARSLYQEALQELEMGRVRDAAEKAWGATLRATNALILARTGKEIEGARGTTKEFLELVEKDQKIDEKLRGRYFTKESFLHGHCFYMGMCEPIEQVKRWIKEATQYIDDTEKLVESKE